MNIAEWVGDYLQAPLGQLRSDCCCVPHTASLLTDCAGFVRLVFGERGSTLWLGEGHVSVLAR